MKIVSNGFENILENTSNFAIYFFVWLERTCCHIPSQVREGVNKKNVADMSANGGGELENRCIFVFKL